MRYYGRQIWRVLGGPNRDKWGVEYPNGGIDYVKTRDEARRRARENASLYGEGNNYFVPSNVKLY